MPVRSGCILHYVGELPRTLNVRDVPYIRTLPAAPSRASAYHTGLLKGAQSRLVLSETRTS